MEHRRSMTSSNVPRGTLALRRRGIEREISKPAFGAGKVGVFPPRPPLRFGLSEHPDPRAKHIMQPLSEVPRGTSATMIDASVPRGTPTIDDELERSPWNTGAVDGGSNAKFSKQPSSVARSGAREHAECSRSGRQGAAKSPGRRGHPEKLGDRSLPPTRSKIPTPRGERRPRREHSACGSMAQPFPVELPRR